MDDDSLECPGTPGTELPLPEDLDEVRQTDSPAKGNH